MVSTKIFLSSNNAIKAVSQNFISLYICIFFSIKLVLLYGFIFIDVLFNKYSQVKYFNSELDNIIRVMSLPRYYNLSKIYIKDEKGILIMN